MTKWRVPHVLLVERRMEHLRITYRGVLLGTLHPTIARGVAEYLMRFHKETP